MNTDHNWDPLKIRVAAYYFNLARQRNKEVGISAKQDAWVAGQIMDYEREGRAPMELTDWYGSPMIRLQTSSDMWKDSNLIPPTSLSGR